MATAAYLIGEDAASVEARSRAHYGFIECGEPIRASRSAFWLAFAMLTKPHQQSQAGGWLARARRLLDESAQEYPEHGFLLCALGFQKVVAGDVAASHAAFQQTAAIGVRFKQSDLIALARMGVGRTLTGLNQTAHGLEILDEVMVAVTSGEVAPMVAGVVYCGVIGVCQQLFDVQRAREWTMALTDWCAARPDIMPFRGQCLIQRSELLQLRGAWPEAIDEAERACTALTNYASEQEVGARNCRPSPRT